MWPKDAQGPRGGEAREHVPERPHHELAVLDRVPELVLAEALEGASVPPAGIRLFFLYGLLPISNQDGSVYAQLSRAHPQKPDDPVVRDVGKVFRDVAVRKLEGIVVYDIGVGVLGMAAQQVVFDGLKAREVVEPYEAAVERFAAGGKASGAEVLDAFRDDVSRVVKAAESAETGEQPENISRKSLEFGVEGGLLKRFPEVLSAPPQFVAAALARFNCNHLQQRSKFGEFAKVFVVAEIRGKFSGDRLVQGVGLEEGGDRPAELFGDDVGFGRFRLRDGLGLCRCLLRVVLLLFRHDAVSSPPGARLPRAAGRGCWSRVSGAAVRRARFG